ncbi:MAG: hypothetical protein OEN56_04200 [Gemmatimonadota bacterium]|nr:hypothetical protein [Gemmatimonadota bacterium]
MSTMDCAGIREMIPEVASGRAGQAGAASVEAHAGSCEGCRAELALARLVYQSRPQAPAELADRIISTMRRDRRRLQRPWWGISAAAVAALALGIGITARPAADTLDLLDVEVALEDETELWLSDDGVLAGAPVFDALSDEALAELLDELQAIAPPGGQA